MGHALQMRCPRDARLLQASDARPHPRLRQQLAPRHAGSARGAMHNCTIVGLQSWFRVSVRLLVLSAPWGSQSALAEYGQCTCTFQLLHVHHVRTQN